MTENRQMMILHRFANTVIRIASFANMAGATVLFALVAIMNADVFARGVLHAPIRGVVELVIFALVLIVFLQLPDVVQGNRLTRSDGFLLFVGRNNQRISEIMHRVINAIAAIFFALVTWAIWPEFLESFESCHFFSQPEFGPPPTGNLLEDLSAAMARCDYFGTPGIFTAPWWPAKLAVSFSMAMCCILLIFKVLLGSQTGQSATTSAPDN